MKFQFVPDREQSVLLFEGQVG